LNDSLSPEQLHEARLQSFSNHPLRDAFYPGDKEFLQTHTLSPRLNPFARENIAIRAVTVQHFPNLKAVPVYQMMVDDLYAGKFDGKHTLILPSSGNTAWVGARFAPACGFRKSTVVIPSDTPPAKRDVLAALGELVEVLAVSDTMAKALEEAEKPGTYLLDQYSHPSNPGAHKTYTGPMLRKVIKNSHQGGRPISIVAIALGTAGTLMGVSWDLKEQYPDIRVIGVRPAVNVAIPGARNAEKMAAVVKFPWENYADGVVETNRKEAFVETRRLGQEVEPPPGVTSGMVFLGLIRYIAQLPVKEREALRGTQAAFLCPDGVQLYSDYMTSELDPPDGILRP